MKLNGKVVVLLGGLLLIGILSPIFKNRIFLLNKNQNKKLQITASFYPLANLAKHVGGQIVMVTDITPPGAEPHDYEPTPQDIVKITAAKILLLNGNGLDIWADKLIPTLKSKGTMVVKMSDFLGAGNNDPHFWLDPINYEKMTTIIRDTLLRADKIHAAYYETNANRYLKELDRLNADYENGLKSCRLKEVIVSHDAFSYLAKRYHFTTLFIAGITPDEEPSPKKIAEITAVAKEKNIKYIFFETLVSPKIADTIAAEAKAQTLVLDPLEGLTAEKIKMGKNYINIMKDNLVNLRKAMLCQ